MPYVGHNVYGRREQDYAVRTGIIDEPGFPDVWCEPCWWQEFGEQATSTDEYQEHHARELERFGYSTAWGGAHGALGFYWWPARMMGEGPTCRSCGLSCGDAAAVEREQEHRAKMQGGYVA